MAYINGRWINGNPTTKDLNDPTSFTHYAQNIGRDITGGRNREFSSGLKNGTGIDPNSFGAIAERQRYEAENGGRELVATEAPAYSPSRGWEMERSANSLPVGTRYVDILAERYKMGKTLSADEMTYLKEVYPDLFKGV